MEVSGSPRSQGNGSNGTAAGGASSTATAPTPPGGARRALETPRRPGGTGVPFASLLAAACGRPGTKGLFGAADGASAKDGLVGSSALGGEVDGVQRSIANGLRSSEGEGGAEGEDDGLGATVAPAPPEAEDDGDDVKLRPGDDSDWLDPSARRAAQLAPPGTLGNPVDVTAVPSTAPVRARSLEELLPALVRRIAWAGDRHKGTVRLELGSGAYAGATVMVHADGGRVRVEIGGHEGPELDRLRTRLDARLRGHGLDVESVT